MSRPREQSAHRARILVARDREQEHLSAALERARNEQLGLVLISGEPGIGKTRLIQTFLESQTSDLTIIEARCYPGAAPPMSAIWSALRAAAEQAIPDWDQAIDRAGLSGFLASRPGSDTPANGQVPDISRTVDRVAVLFQTLAETRPVILALDDAQWATEPELDLIRYVLRSPRSLPILVLLSYRDTEIDPRGALQQLIRDAYREAPVERIALTRIGEHGARQLIGAILDSPAHTISRPLAQSIQQEAEGVPFFVEELVLHLFETGALRREGKNWSISTEAGIDIPQSIHGVITSRLMTLSPPAQETISIGAIYGRVFPLDLLIEVTRRLGATSSEDVAAHLDEALSRSLVIELPVDTAGSARDQYAFAHDQIREALVRDLNAIRRRILHQAIAETLEEIGNPQEPGYEATLAHHFGNGEDLERASKYAERAGDRDFALGAFRQAAVHYTTALDVHTLRRGNGHDRDPVREQRLLARRQSAYSEIGDTDAQLRDIQRWHELANQQSDVDQQFQATDAMARFAIAQGDQNAAQKRAAELESLAGDNEKHRRTALIRLGESRIGRPAGDPARITAKPEDLARARDAFEQALSLDPGNLDPVLQMEIGKIDWELAGDKDRELRGAARARISGALQTFRDLNDDRGEITALITLAYRRQLSGGSSDPDQGTPFVTFLEEIRRLRGEERLLIRESDRARNQARAALAVHVHCREFGMPYRALQSGHDALNWADAAGDRRIMFHALGGLSQTELLLGRSDHALDFAERAMALVESGTPHVSRQQALIWIGCAAASNENPVRAIEVLREAVEIDEVGSARPLTVEAMTRLADVLALDADPGLQDEALSLTEQIERTTDGQPGKIPWGVEARRVRSLIYQQRDDLEQALAAASGALAHLDARSITQRRLTLSVQLQAARLMIEADRQTDGLAILQSAAHALVRTLADIEDQQLRSHAETTVPLYVEIQQLARDHGVWPGEHPQPSKQARPGGLSRREIEVLQLVAIGKTNRTIADELFISEKTVARHLTNIYTKIGIESRTQAAAWAYQNAIA